jgi:hypothetical protein
VASDLRAALRGQAGAARRAGAIVAGLALTGFAYAKTRLSGAVEALSRHLFSRV